MNSCQNPKVVPANTKYAEFTKEKNGNFKFVSFIDDKRSLPLEDDDGQNRYFLHTYQDRWDNKYHLMLTIGIELLCLDKHDQITGFKNEGNDDIVSIPYNP